MTDRLDDDGASVSTMSSETKRVHNMGVAVWQLKLAKAKHRAKAEAELAAVDELNIEVGI